MSDDKLDEFDVIEESPKKEEAISEQDKARARRALFLITFILLGVFGGWLWYSRAVSAIGLQPGVYLGRINAAELASFDIFAEKEINGLTKLVPFSPDWPVQETESDPLKEVPIEISSAGVRLLLVIDQLSGRVYTGRVFLAGTSSAVGSWRLELVDNFKFSEIADTELVNIKQGLHLFAEEQQRVNRLTQLQSEIVTIREKIAAGGHADSESAAEQVDLLAAQVIQAKKENVKLAEKLTALNNKRDVELKVSKAGKLVQLAREAEGREERWRSSQYRTDLESLNPALFQKLQDARRILQLKAEIQNEQRRLFGVRGQ